MKNPPPAPQKPAENKRFRYICLAVILMFVALVRYRLLGIPLERDEGEYALIGQLILKGIPPYEMAYSMKLPGTSYLYALFMAVFGQSATGVHLGLLVVNLASILLVFFIGKKLLNETSALFSTASFALLSLSPGVFGFAAHATQFNALFGLCGLLALLQYAERPSWFRLAGSGFCFGLAFVMKQQAVFLMLFGLLAFWLIERQREPAERTKTALRFAGYSSAMVLPYLLMLLTAWLTGTFDGFWHWTVEYAGQYVGIKTGSDAWRLLNLNFPGVIEGYGLFWLTGLVGLAALFFPRTGVQHRWLILAFAVFSFACVVPGLYFRQHYFIVFLPALALLVGVGLHFLEERLPQKHWVRFLPLLFFACMMVLAIVRHGTTFFKEDLNKMVARTYSPTNPFEASLEIGRFLGANSSERDKIAILGSEPQIYFYSKRLPATGFIYAYPLMENQPYSLDMQRAMIAEIEKARPKFMIFVNSPFSWTKSDASAKDIFNWYDQYRSQYNMVGLVDLNPTGKPTYVWREALNGYTPKNKAQVWVYERK